MADVKPRQFQASLLSCVLYSLRGMEYDSNFDAIGIGVMPLQVAEPLGEFFMNMGITINIPSEDRALS